jgi:hypothetical protein
MIQVLETFFARNDFAMWRKDGRDAHQILRGNSCIPEGQLKGGQAFLVFAYALGEKNLLRDHAFSQFLCVLREVGIRCFYRTFPHEFIAFRRMSTGCFWNSSHVYTLPLFALQAGLRGQAGIPGRLEQY